MKYALLFLAAAFFLAGCTSPTDPSASPSPSPVSLSIDATDPDTDFYAVDSTLTDVTLNLGGNTRDLYLTFTNQNLGTVAPSNLAVSLSESSSRSLVADSGDSARVGSRSMGGSWQGSGRPYNPRGSALISERNEKNARNLLSLKKSGPVSRGLLTTPQTPHANYVVGTSTQAFTSGGLGDPTIVLRKATLDEPTPHGNRSLYVWVASDCWGGDSSGTGATGTVGTTGVGKRHLVTQKMVDALADKFLKAGGTTNDDVYDWDSNIFGAEWGTDLNGYDSYLIPFNADGDSNNSGEIHIVIWDISNDNSDNGGILGYFSSYDNFLNTAAGYEDSNQMIAFSIDAVMLADSNADAVDTSTDDTAWDIADYWPEEMVSTLAHEFQHMIEFYQKAVLKDTVGFDTWIDEMLAMLAEDLLSDKLGVKGPRGIIAGSPDYSAGVSSNGEGRLPLFDYYNNINLTNWSSSFDEVLQNYAIAYAFGAYLLRERGGIATIRAMYENSATGAGSISAAVSSVEDTTVTFGDILRDWGAAVLLSDNQNGVPSAKHGYNAGGTSPISFTYGGITYDLGSVNMFNYAYDLTVNGHAVSGTGPRIFTNMSTVPTLKPQSNTYLKLASGWSGTHTFRISVPTGVTVGVVLK